MVHGLFLVSCLTWAGPLLDMTITVHDALRRLNGEAIVADPPGCESTTSKHVVLVTNYFCVSSFRRGFSVFQPMWDLVRRTSALSSGVRVSECKVCPRVIGSFLAMAWNWRRALKAKGPRYSTSWVFRGLKINRKYCRFDSFFWSPPLAKTLSRSNENLLVLPQTREDLCLCRQFPWRIGCKYTRNW